MPATYEPIATTTLGSAAASITFSSIPATYTDLRVVIVGNTSNSTQAQSWLRFNSDSTNLYSSTWIYGDGSTAGSIRVSSQTQMRGQILNGGSTAMGLGIYDIFSYAGSTNKTVLTDVSADANGSGRVDRMVGLWRSTSAINAIEFSIFAGNWITGTTATLYGIKNA
jgi:hypothetical protein